MISRLALTLTLGAFASLTGCTTMTTPSTNLEVVRALAPDGRLRAAINFGNPILANKDAKTVSRSACPSISPANSVGA